MIQFRNNYIPFKGYKAMMLFGILFIRGKDTVINEIDLNHEEIHFKQMVEMLIIPFYIWYGIEWLIKLFKYKDTHKAYRNISFERESYQNENNLEYLTNRKCYSWFKYIKNNI